MIVLGPGSLSETLSEKASIRASGNMLYQNLCDLDS